jgi:hypothetical protein
MSSFFSQIKKHVQQENVKEEIQRKEASKIYLNVPFEYKNKAKALGAKWDIQEKQWYVLSDCPNKQELVDIYHIDNFHTDFYGHHLRNKIVTESERKIKRERENTEYKKLKQEWIDKHGNDDNFGIWYSVNILGHE